MATNIHDLLYGPGGAFSAEAGLDNAIIPYASQPLSATDKKLQRLQERTALKQQKLGTNNLTGNQLQQEMSNLYDNQVYRDKVTGQRYRERQYKDEFGNVQFERIDIPDTVPSKWGDLDTTRNLYLQDAMKDGGDRFKLGLADRDVGYAGRYDPNNPLSIAESKRRGEQYGWDSGKQGVDPHATPLQNTEFMYDDATRFEDLVHENKGMDKAALIDQDVYHEYKAARKQARAAGVEPGDPEFKKYFDNPEWYSEYKKLGGGGSEYYDPNNPLMSGGNRNYKGDESSVLGSTLRFPQAMVSGFGKSIYDVADTNVELVGTIGGRVVGMVDPEAGQAIDNNFDLGNEDTKTKNVNAATGYDNSYSADLMQSATDHHHAAVKDFDVFKPSTYMNYHPSEDIKAVGDMLSSPETIGYSLGYLAPYAYGLAERAVVKSVGGVVGLFAEHTAKVAAASAGKKIAKKEAVSLLADGAKHLEGKQLATYVAKADGLIAKAGDTIAKKDISKVFETSMGIRDRVKLFVARNIDTTIYGGVMNNDQMDEWIVENGGDTPSLFRLGFGTFINAVAGKVDIGSAKFALHDSKELVQAFADQFKYIPKKKAAKVMAESMKFGARILASGFEEAGQEWTQSLTEAFNRVYGTDDRSALDVATSPDVLDKAMMGAIGGAAGGSHMVMGRGGAPVLAKVGKILAEDTKVGEVATNVANATTGAVNAAKDKINTVKNSTTTTEAPMDQEDTPVTRARSARTMDDLKAEVETFIVEVDTKAKAAGVTVEEYIASDKKTHDTFTALRKEQNMRKAEEVAANPATSEVLNATGAEEAAIIQGYMSADADKLEGYEAKILQDTKEHGTEQDIADVTEIFTRAKEERAKLDELSGLQQSRESVEFTGLDADKRGFREYYLGARRAQATGDTAKFENNVGRLKKFTSSQVKKRDTLDSIRTAAVEEIGTRINSTLAKAQATDSTITLKDVVQAMAGHATMANKNEAVSTSMDKVSAALGVDAKELHIRDKDNVIYTNKYAAEVYNRLSPDYKRELGKFEINADSALMDYIAENKNDVNDAGAIQYVGGYAKSPGSGATKTITAIDDEVTMMYSMTDMLEGKKPSSESHRGTQETQTDDTQVNTQEKAEEPLVALQAPVTPTKPELTVAEIAKVIGTRALTDEEKVVARANRAEIEKIRNLKPLGSTRPTNSSIAENIEYKNNLTDEELKHFKTNIADIEKELGAKWVARKDKLIPSIAKYIATTGKHYASGERAYIYKMYQEEVDAKVAEIEAAQAPTEKPQEPTEPPKAPTGTTSQGEPTESQDGTPTQAERDTKVDNVISVMQDMYSNSPAGIQKVLRDELKDTLGIGKNVKTTYKAMLAELNKRAKAEVETEEGCK